MLDYPAYWFSHSLSLDSFFTFRSCPRQTHLPRAVFHACLHISKSLPGEAWDKDLQHWPAFDRGRWASRVSGEADQTRERETPFACSFLLGPFAESDSWQLCITRSGGDRSNVRVWKGSRNPKMQGYSWGDPACLQSTTHGNCVFASAHLGYSARR